MKLESIQKQLDKHAYLFPNFTYTLVKGNWNEKINVIKVICGNFNNVLYIHDLVKYKSKDVLLDMILLQNKFYEIKGEKLGFENGKMVRSSEFRELLNIKEC